jgi:polyisoprenoid-binding protein YceI
MPQLFDERKHPMFRLTLLLFLATQAPALAAEPQKPAPSGTYVADPTHTSLTWKINHFGLSNYTARFGAVSASLDWNAQQPDASRLKVTIDPKSVRTDYPFPKVEDFDRKIGTAPEFFAGQPITFEATDITLDGDRTGIVTAT